MLLLLLETSPPLPWYRGCSFSSEDLLNWSITSTKWPLPANIPVKIASPFSGSLVSKLVLFKFLLLVSFKGNINSLRGRICPNVYPALELFLEQRRPSQIMEYITCKCYKVRLNCITGRETSMKRDKRNRKDAVIGLPVPVTSEANGNKIILCKYFNTSAYTTSAFYMLFSLIINTFATLTLQPMSKVNHIG